MVTEPVVQGKNMNFIDRHFRRHLERRPWDFCWKIGIESTAVSLVVAALLSPFFGNEERAFLNWPIPAMFLMLVIIAPPIETLLFQAFPIFIVRMFRGSIRSQILFSTIVFAAVHFIEGIAAGVAAGVVGGLYFAFAYAHWRTRSRWRSLWITTACHAIHNGIAFILLVIFMGLS